MFIVYMRLLRPYWLMVCCVGHVGGGHVGAGHVGIEHVGAGHVGAIM